MSKKQREPSVTRHSDVDVCAALECGDAFFRLAQPFISAVPSRFEEAQTFAGEKLGDMSAAAVNLALAIEIYLKALIANSGKPFPNEHTLATLFDELPSGLQKTISTQYEEGTQHQKASDSSAGALQVEVVRRDSSRPAAEWRQFPRGFKALLQRNARNFVAWRYLFASETREGAPLSFEFENMNIGARILRRLLPETEAVRRNRDT